MCRDISSTAPLIRRGRRVGRRLLTVLAACAALLPGSADATTIPYRTDGDLVALSDRVVHGRVLAVRTEEDARTGRIYTVTRLAILEDFTGVDEREIEVRELGGRAGEREMWVPGAARFVVGDQVILCLERGASGLRSVAMSFSAFHVVARGGVTSVERFSAGATVIGGARETIGSRTLEGFRQVVSAVRGVRSIVPAGAAPEAAPAQAPGAPVFDHFTLLGSGMRWRQADTDTPVLWYRNTDRPSPLTSGNIDTEITTSLAAWTNPSTARLALTYGGTRSAGGTSVTDVFCTSVNSGAGLISFEDPENDIGSGVLAVGGGCAGGPVHTVNNQSFYSFSHGFVVFNDAAQLGASYRMSPSFTRVLTHEIGHGIGLGHASAQTELMYPSCCYPSMPMPPTIGPDDLAGVTFIYPMPAGPQDPPPCIYGISPTTASFPSGGGAATVAVTASSSSCAWTATSNAGWIVVTSGSSGTGSGTVGYNVLGNAGAVRSGSVTIAGHTLSIAQEPESDTDGDGLPDWWETAFGLNPNSAAGNDGAAGDPDGDSASNLAEYTNGTHPRGFVTRYLAEGAVNAFFSTEIALLNATATPITTLIRVQPQGESERNTFFTVAPRTRRTLTTSDLAALTGAPFATVIESDGLLVIDRTMSWDATGYGAHAETAVQAPSTTWYLAEGATAGDFSLFYLLQNPNTTATTATVRYLRAAPHAPIELTYSLPPNSRTTIPVDTAAPELASADVSAVITATLPIIVERSMYLNRPGQPFVAGHESAGVTTPATTWFLAEGATGPFFELFVLIANPNATAASVDIDYLLPDGSTLTRNYAVAANSRFTIWVDEEDFPSGKALASQAMSMRVRSVNSVPIIVERSMWWPQPFWYESHNAPGTTVTGTRWGLAGGETGGGRAWRTYVLIANTSTFAGQARVTLYFEDSTTATTTVSLPAQSRTNVDVAAVFPATANRRFSVVVESLGVTPPQIVVERAMYSNANGLLWSAGTAAVATRLAP